LRAQRAELEFSPEVENKKSFSLYSSELWRFIEFDGLKSQGLKFVPLT